MSGRERRNGQMVLVVSPQFQGIKRAPRRQVRWRPLLAHGVGWVAYVHLKLNGSRNFQESFSLISPRMNLGLNARHASQHYQNLKLLLNRLERLSQTVLRHQAKMTQSTSRDGSQNRGYFHIPPFSPLQKPIALV
jgi:hypothetical protein